jgi:hypothetical protein
MIAFPRFAARELQHRNELEGLLLGQQLKLLWSPSPNAAEPRQYWSCACPAHAHCFMS